MSRRVVITGMGVVTSLSCDVGELWDKLLAGQSGVQPITLFDASPFESRIAGVLNDFDPASHFGRKNARRLDRFCQFALLAGTRATEQTGLDFSREDPYRCGVILGSGIGGLNEIESQHLRLLEGGPSRVSPFMIPKLMVNAASGCLSIVYGLKGPNLAVATACASANNAMGDALNAIRRDDADVISTGGSEAAITPMGVAGFCALQALSQRNDDPARASRPFDRDRDGFVMSEGAGVVVMESLEHAQARGADILAEVAGFGMAGDGCHITAPDPDGAGAANAMARCLEDARLTVEDVDYINAHGTSTTLGDEGEVRAIKIVFGDDAYTTPISSTKSQLGHLLGASGGVELIATVMALRRGVIPQTINRDTPDPACDLDVVPNEPREADLRVAMCNSFGFGGHDATLAIRRWDGT